MGSGRRVHRPGGGMMYNAENILWVALGLKRGHGSPSINLLVDALVSVAVGQEYPHSIDAAGNLWVDARKNGETTCFMAHLDTVHDKKVSGNQKLFWDDPEQTRVGTDGKDILGADDGAGCALLAGLIIAGIPAMYLFTQGEECGGIGARAIPQSAMAQFDRIISFDRKGTADICGEQFCGNCASREFVSTLADRLAMGHKWACGSYTDNSEFRDTVKEIVNVSVGYANAHTPMELLDVVYWKNLLDACIGIDWETLPTIGPEPDNDKAWGKYDSDPLPAESMPLEELDYLCSTLGWDCYSSEADIVLDALHRCYKAGMNANKPKNSKGRSNAKKSIFFNV